MWNWSICVVKCREVKCHEVKCHTHTLYNFTALLEKFLLLNKVAKISPAKKLLHTETGAHWSLLLPQLRDKASVTCRFNRAIGYQPVDTRWYSRYSFIRTILQTYSADSTELCRTCSGINDFSPNWISGVLVNEKNAAPEGSLKSKSHTSKF